MAHDLDAVRQSAGLHSESATYAGILEDKAEILARTRRRGKALAAAYRAMTEEAVRDLPMDDRALADFACASTISSSSRTPRTRRGTSR